MLSPASASSSKMSITEAATPSKDWAFEVEMMSPPSAGPSKIPISEAATLPNDSDCDSETKSESSLTLYGTSDSDSEVSQNSTVIYRTLKRGCANEEPLFRATLPEMSVKECANSLNGSESESEDNDWKAPSEMSNSEAASSSTDSDSDVEPVRSGSPMTSETLAMRQSKICKKRRLPPSHPYSLRPRPKF
ncbi:uncharacterized protein LOC143922837 [Arctopsyche grandis]|uniref:uncharacterized protein LOC143922837 n=1 Tax=Arctopsyche grandis TaxID=121162 RepID=UPI00406D96F7